MFYLACLLLPLDSTNFRLLVFCFSDNSSNKSNLRFRFSSSLSPPSYALRFVINGDGYGVGRFVSNVLLSFTRVSLTEDGRTPRLIVLVGGLLEVFLVGESSSLLLTDIVFVTLVLKYLFSIISALGFHMALKGCCFSSNPSILTC
ncbi:unnamed protein product [Citrullus colocynthis]|uniref:Uncharacterized protein n=1 Tax=Citrullus colocynthis TaxID=252529 RepID=A0ABP0Y470_9ROSI